MLPWGHVLTASLVVLCQAASRADAESASAEPTTTAVEIAVDAGGGMALGRHSEQLMGITAYGSPNFDQPTINKAGLPDLTTGIVIGGPVTYSPPFQLSGGKIDESTWTQWFEPVLRATADNPRLAQL